MKRSQIILIFMLISMFVLAGCRGSETSTAPPENVINKDVIGKSLNESHKVLKSAAGAGSVEVSQKIDGAEANKSLQYTTDSVYGEDHFFKSLAFTVNHSDGKNYETRVILPTGVYTNDGEGWVQYHTEKVNMGTTYASFYNTFLEAMPKCEVSEENNAYLFTFKGKNAELFKAMASNYNIEIPFGTPENYDLELIVTIDKSNYYISEMVQKVSASEGENTISIACKVNFNAFNADIPIEEPEIIEAYVEPMPEGATPSAKIEGAKTEVVPEETPTETPAETPAE